MSVLAVPAKVVNAVPLSWRDWLLSRSWTCTWTRPTVPVATRAVPVISNAVLFSTTRPSIGAVIVVSGAGTGKGTVLKSKNPTRPVRTPPLNIPSPPMNRPRGVASMALSPSNELEPVMGCHSSALPVGGGDRRDVVATDHLVAEAVAGEALAGAVADVVEARPRVVGASATR